MIDSTDVPVANLCKMSRENFNSMKAVKVFAVGIALTFAAFVFREYRSWYWQIQSDLILVCLDHY